MIGFGILIVPFDWRFGPWSKPHKWLFSIGPIRLVYYPDLSAQTWGQS